MKFCLLLFFYKLINVICDQKLGGATAEIMSDLLSFEADRRAVNITINRFVSVPSLNLTERDVELFFIFYFIIIIIILVGGINC